MQVYAWTVFPLLVFGIWWLKYFIPHRAKPTKPKMWESHGETFRQILNRTSENKFHPRTPISIWPTLITFHQTEHILVPMPCCMSLKTMRPWLRWSSQAEVPRWDMFEGPTELLWIGCLTGLISIIKFRFDTLIPNINSKTFWAKVISHVTNGTNFFICSTSGISAFGAALRIPAW